MEINIPGFQDDEILYCAMDIHSRHFNLYDFVKNGIPQQVNDADLYTLEEVAEITKMSIVTIRQYVRDGRLHAIKQWKNWMVPSNEIARLIYEKLHGVKLEEGTVMLTVLAGDLYEDDSVITEYKIITANDLLSSIDRENLPKSIEVYMKIIVSDAQYIEAISNIDNFFRRSGDIKDENIINADISISDFLATPFEKSSFFVENNDQLLYETPKEALQTIEKHFGVIKEELTLLKMYRVLLDLSRSLKEEER